MEKATERFILTMSVPLKAHGIAQRFCQQQPDANNAKQIYLNTLAVYSVNEYLSYFSIPTSLSTSDSWNPSLQYLSDVADLDIPHYGRLECRPVLPDDTSCFVPPEVWSDRVGYVAVQFDADLKEAAFLGFLPSVQSSSVALDNWKPFETFIETITQAISNVDTSTATAAVVDQEIAPMVQLSRWLDGTIDKGWQLIHHIFLSPELASELAPSFRSTPSVHLIESAQIVCRKQVSWADAANGIPLSLIVGLASSDQSDETDIWVKISTQDPDQHLPLDLELVIVDEQQQTVIQAKSRGTEGIQLRFGGQPNEQFGVRIIQGSYELFEPFVV